MFYVLLLLLFGGSQIVSGTTSICIGGYYYIDFIEQIYECRPCQTNYYSDGTYDTVEWVEDPSPFTHTGGWHSICVYNNAPNCYTKSKTAKQCASCYIGSGFVGGQCIGCVGCVTYNDGPNGHTNPCYDGTAYTGCIACSTYYNRCYQCYGYPYGYYGDPWYICISVMGRECDYYWKSSTEQLQSFSQTTCYPNMCSLTSNSCTGCYAGKYVSTSACIPVSSGYYSLDMDSSQTQNDAANCWGRCTTSNTCTSCSAGSYLAYGNCGGNCITCSTGWSYNGNTLSSCTPSSASNCVGYCTTSDTCTSCLAGYYRAYGYCGGNCLVCGGGTWSSSGNTLSSCPTNDADGCVGRCTISNTCTTCIAGYYRAYGYCGGNCLVCSTGTWSSSGNTLSSCSNNNAAGCFDRCTTSNTCTTCIAGYYRAYGYCGGNCLVCGTGTWSSNGNSLSSCSNNNAAGCVGRCTTSNTCTSCTSGNYLAYGNCGGNCPACGTGTWSSYGNTLSSCSTNNAAGCVGRCTTSNTCTTCVAGYYIPSGTCGGGCTSVSSYGSGYWAPYNNALTTPYANSASGCVGRCTTSNTCTSCIAGYYRAYGYCGGNCLVCGTGTWSSYGNSLSSCSTNSAAGCVGRCTASNTCTSCTSGYYLAYGYCGGDCIVCSAGTWSSYGNTASSCNTNDAASCVGRCTSSNTCTTCVDGYYLPSGTCGGDCTSVSSYGSGYWAPYNNALTTPYVNSAAGCVGRCTSSNSCTSCKAGYSRANGYCGGDCLVCDTGTWSSYGNTLSSCSNNTATGCFDRCTTSDTCTSCIAGYYLGINGECSNDCMLCGAGNFSLNDNTLVECSLNTADNCIERCTTSNTCITCEAGFHLPAEGACNDRCYTCSTNTWSFNNNSLTVCNTNDASYCYDRCTTSNTCISCYAGYHLDSGSCSSCVLCEINTYSTDDFILSECESNTASNCIGRCITSNNCSSCEAGYGFSGSLCGVCSPCNSGYYNPDDSSSACIENTAENCANKSTTDNLCITCNPGYEFISGICNPCLFGEFSAGGIDLCETNNAINCFTKSSTADKCLTCVIGYGYYSGDCYECIEPTYSKGNISECQNNNAQYCFEKSTFDELCLSCDAGYSFLDGVCNPCVECTSWSQEENQGPCVEFSASNCSECSLVVDECTSCLAGFGMYTSPTLCTACSSELRTYATHQTIIPCQPNTALNCYVTSTVNNVCAFCIEGFGFSNGNCSTGCVPCNNWSANGTQNSCEDFTKLHCDTCSISNDACLTCDPGYELSSPNCDSCSIDYYSLGGADITCHPNTAPNCQDKSNSVNECTSCLAGFGYDIGPPVTCTSCVANINYSAGGTSQCLISTAPYCNVSSTIADVCISCIAGYGFSLGICTQCDAGVSWSSGGIDNCNNFTAENCNASSILVDRCETCNTGFVMTVDICSLCSAGEYYDGSCFPNTAEHCLSKSATANLCLSCIPGYGFYSSNCIACESGFYSIGFTSTCLINNAQHCYMKSTNVEACTSCLGGYKFSDGSCTSCTPCSGYSLNGTTSASCTLFSAQNCDFCNLTSDYCTTCVVNSGYAVGPPVTCTLCDLGFKSLGVTDICHEVALPPTSVVLSNVTHDSLAITWKSGDANDCVFSHWNVMGYIIANETSEIPTPLGCKPEDFSSRSILYCVASGLNPLTTYSFSVSEVCNNPAANSNVSAMSSEVTTSFTPTPAETPTEFKVIAYGGTSIVLSWEAGLPYSCIFSYWEVLSADNSTIHGCSGLFYRDLTMCTVDGLTPNTTYHFTVKEVCKNSEYDSPRTSPLAAVTFECGSNCATCDMITRGCFTCIDTNYYFTGPKGAMYTTCVAECPPSFFAGIAGAQCSPCDIKCTTCHSETGGCTSCQLTNRWLSGEPGVHDTICVPTCEGFKNESIGSQAKCLPICPILKYAQVNEVCKNCDETCLRCHPIKGGCTLCQENGEWLSGIPGELETDCTEDCGDMVKEKLSGGDAQCIKSCPVGYSAEPNEVCPAVSDGLVTVFYIAGGILALILLIIVISCIGRFRKIKDQHVFTVVTVFVAVYDFVTDTMLLYSIQDNKKVELHFRIGSLLLIVAMIVNFILLFRVLSKHMKKEPVFRIWLKDRTGMFGIITLLSVTNLNVTSLWTSNLCGLRIFAAPLGDAEINLKGLGVVSHIVEDIPQLIIQLSIGQTLTGIGLDSIALWPPLLIMSVSATIISLVCGVFARGLLLCAVNTSRNQGIKKNPLSAKGALPYVFSNDNSKLDSDSKQVSPNSPQDIIVPPPGSNEVELPVREAFLDQPPNASNYPRLPSESNIELLSQPQYVPIFMSNSLAPPSTEDVLVTTEGNPEQDESQMEDKDIRRYGSMLAQGKISLEAFQRLVENRKQKLRKKVEIFALNEQLNQSDLTPEQRAMYQAQLDGYMLDAPPSNMNQLSISSKSSQEQLLV